MWRSEGRRQPCQTAVNAGTGHTKPGTGYRVLLFDDIKQVFYICMMRFAERLQKGH